MLRPSFIGPEILLRKSEAQSGSLTTIKNSCSASSNELDSNVLKARHPQELDDIGLSLTKK
jgi:hypothetical protein